MCKTIRNILVLFLLVSFFPIVSCSKSNFEFHFDSSSHKNGFNRHGENPFVDASSDEVSTFNVNVAGASYSYMRESLKRKHLPLRFSVRIEEYLNYFTYDFAAPENGAPVAINGEIGMCPWNENHRLMKLGIKGRVIPINQLPPSNYVFMLDVSGSMNSEGKLPLMKSAMKQLVDKLGPDDRISIITYSGDVRVALSSTKVSDASKIKEAVSDLRAEGKMADGNALELAYEEALAHYVDGGNNRVIIATDGDFNFGLSSTDAIYQLVDEYAEKGISLSLCGLETGDVDASLMETIANRGNGSYVYMDSIEELVKVFAYERTEFYKVADASKARIRFNPEYIRSWRQIGYDNGALSSGDVVVDKRCSNSIGSGQTAIALYELVPTEKYASCTPVATFDFSCQDCGQDFSTTIEVVESKSAMRMLPELDFAAGVAAYGMVLMNSQYKGSATLQMAEKLVASGLPFDEHGYRAELMELISKARTLMK